MQLDDRLALAALRGLMMELETGPGAHDVLLRVLAGGAAEPTAPPGPSRVVEHQPPSAPGKRHKGRTPAPAAKRADPETARLLAAAVKRHGSVGAAATAVGVSRAAWSAWGVGRSRPNAASLARLRASLEDAAEPAEPEPAVTEAAAPAAPPAVTETPEQARLVATLRQRYDDPAARFGFGPEAFNRWGLGGPISPSTLGRLRDAASAAPPPDAHKGAAADDAA